MNIRFRSLLVGLLSCLTSLGACSFIQATTSPIAVTVVDAETGLPLRDAQVVYLLEAREGTWTGHGGRVAQLAVYETITNADGKALIPSQGISPRPFGLSTNLECPEVIVFKSGFLPEYARSLWAYCGMPTLDEVVHWPKSQTPVKLKRPESQKQHLDRLSGLNSELVTIASRQDSGQCGWEKIAHSIVAFEDEALRLDGTNGDRKNISTPLRWILGNEADARSRDSGRVDVCASAVAHFQRYPPACPQSSERMTAVRRKRVDDCGTATIGYCESTGQHWMNVGQKGWQEVAAGYSLNSASCR